MCYSDPVPARSPSHGERRRQEILGTALDLGSAHGIESLSIGRLADALGMSRSGVFAHFGSKEELQLATIAAAQADFEEKVLAPAQDAEPGLDKLTALFGSWLDYVEGIAFRGGCFFAMTTSEFGSREGPVRERLAQLSLTWIRDLLREARTAKRQRELSEDCDPEQIVFRLHAFGQEANWARELLDDDGAFDRAREAGAELLESLRAPQP